MLILKSKMDEDSSEEVLFDLDQMDISDLRLMARQNDLSTEGGRAALLSRIRESFGFNFDDQIEVAVASASDSKSEQTKNLTVAPEQPAKQGPDAKRAKKAPSSSTVTSAATGRSSAEVKPGFGQDRVEVDVPSKPSGNYRLVHVVR